MGCTQSKTPVAPDVSDLFSSAESEAQQSEKVKGKSASKPASDTTAATTAGDGAKETKAATAPPTTSEAQTSKQHAASSGLVQDPTAGSTASKQPVVAGDKDADDKPVPPLPDGPLADMKVCRQ